MEEPLIQDYNFAMKDKSSFFAIISGACFILYSISSLFFRTIPLFSYYRYCSAYDIIHMLNMYFISFGQSGYLFLFSIVSLIVFSITLIVQKKNILTLCSWCIYAAFSIYNYSPIFNFRHIFNIVIDTLAELTQLSIGYGSYNSIDYGFLSFTSPFANLCAVLYLFFMTIIILFIYLPRLKKYIVKLPKLCLAPIAAYAISIISSIPDTLFYCYKGLIHYRDYYQVFMSGADFIIKLIGFIAVVFFCFSLWFELRKLNEQKNHL